MDRAVTDSAPHKLQITRWGTDSTIDVESVDVAYGLVWDSILTVAWAWGDLVDGTGTVIKTHDELYDGALVWGDAHDQ